MRRLLAWTLAAAGALTLCACDQTSADGKASVGSSESAAPVALSAPEPARFAKPGPPGATTTKTTAPKDSALAQATTAAVKPGLSSLEGTAAKASTVFDGSKAALASVSPEKAGAVPSKTIRNRQMKIDTDGLTRDPAERRWVAGHDHWHQNRTALNAGGRPLDATAVPYVSIPGDFRGAKVGDIVLVSYQGRRSYAVVGDVGPEGRFGEGSVALARRLGINPDGNSGGVSSGVNYTFFPGTHADTSSEQALLSDLESRGPQLAAGAGLGADAPIQLASL
jgi:hypothetical protein